MSNNDRQLNHALDLMRRLPPQSVEENLTQLVDLVPNMTESLLCCIDQPLQVSKDFSCGKDYLLCDYNRDADSHRSPWSNQYFPPLEDGAVPSDRLRSIEIELNSAMQRYRELYYGGGSIASAYLWDLDSTAKGFAGAVLIKKCGSSGCSGQWDSVHVIEVTPKVTGRSAKYKLTATVMLRLVSELRCKSDDVSSDSSEFDIAGSLTRQAERESPAALSSANESAIAAAHIANIGRLIEETETSMRQQLIDVYFDNVCGVVETMRTSLSKESRMARELLQRELNEAINRSSPLVSCSKLLTD
uniref:F-actin-capping protein subunit beta n=1 Tax=Macrostomum lignano TaxID=282301 RepID=A0A1I8I993_9PLAT